ncbi:sporulation histidine kinase inhibitor Sda [Bacillus tamaricis]|uniref:Sporulation histidine kinase inhibitor Sda n=2 Tax=Evansella tamaricis TaxID=2069301 RepID=A0ABS6JD06_9BACI|nr:sporulation histidine kinase inhibitor Sda [Evansella tamaricis]
MHLLSDELIIKAYKDAIRYELSSEFIDVLHKEITARRLEVDYYG